MFCSIFNLDCHRAKTNKQRRRAGNNCAIVSRSGYIWIWSGARDQESTNHSAHFVEWKSSYITMIYIWLRLLNRYFVSFSERDGGNCGLGFMFNVHWYTTWKTCTKFTSNQRKNPKPVIIFLSNSSCAFAYLGTSLVLFFRLCDWPEWLLWLLVYLTQVKTAAAVVVINLILELHVNGVINYHQYIANLFKK